MCQAPDLLAPRTHYPGFALKYGLLVPGLYLHLTQYNRLTIHISRGADTFRNQPTIKLPYLRYYSAGHFTNEEVDQCRWFGKLDSTLEISR